MKIQFLYIVIAAAIIILVYTNKEAIAEKLPSLTPGDQGGGGNNASPVPAAANLPAGLDFDKVLISGARGPEVVQLQKWINQAGYTPPLVADGVYGIKTANAVKKYTGGAASITLRQAYELIIAALKKSLF